MAPRSGRRTYRTATRRSGSYRAKRRTRSFGRRASSFGKMRRSRRTYRRPRRMTRRKVLNASTIKKRDTMLCWTNTNGGTETVGPALFSATSGQHFAVVWSPTCRGSTSSGGLRGSKFFVQNRTASTTYAVGVSERIKIQTTQGSGWHWRRICFTLKGDTLYTGRRATFTLSDSPVARITSDGLKRAVLLSEDALRTRSVIFKGAQNVDWSDPMLAPIDTNRITPLYDRTFKIQSQNESGRTLVKKLWHPMRRNIVYDEDENGEAMTESFYSVEGKAGMGDYYIADFFTSDATAADSSPSSLLFNPQATYYWHER
uniref:Capsid protein n=1 Tax=Myotis capaccinii feces associated gemycircularvirus TaxID=3139979 RepID=A0AAU6S5A3_9VIRU